MFCCCFSPKMVLSIVITNINRKIYIYIATPGLHQTDEEPACSKRHLSDSLLLYMFWYKPDWCRKPANGPSNAKTNLRRHIN